jgi:hypothetical protein
MRGIFRLTKIPRTKEFLQTDDLCALRRSRTYLAHSVLHVDLRLRLRLHLY